MLLPLPSLALTVGPVKLEHSIDPGNSISGQILLLNDREETKTFYPVFEKYIEVDGEKKFLPGESEIASWFELPSAVTLEPNEQKMIPFTIRIPEGAEPGGHFAVMWWSTAPPVKEPGSEVAIVSRVGILVYLRISGEIQESGRLVSFGVSNQKRFLNYLPINFSVVFESTGNVHLKPQGEIKIKDIFGRTKEVLKVNEFGLSVLPQSKKTFVATWGSKEESAGQKKSGFFSQLKNERQGFAFGLYKAELQLEYGEDKKQSQEKFTFLVIPWRILIFVILILALLSFGIVKGIKRYNQWIIAKAKAR